MHDPVNGFTTKEIVLDIRAVVYRLSEKVDRIDRQGSIGTKSELEDHEERIRKMEISFNRWIGVMGFIAFVLSPAVYILLSFHLWG